MSWCSVFVTLFSYKYTQVRDLQSRLTEKSAQKANLELQHAAMTETFHDMQNLLVRSSWRHVAAVDRVMLQISLVHDGYIMFVYRCVICTVSALNAMS